MRHMVLLRSSVSLVTLVAAFSLVASPGCKSSPLDQTQQFAPEEILEYDTGVFAVRQGPQELLGEYLPKELRRQGTDPAVLSDPQAYVWRNTAYTPAVEFWALLQGWEPAGKVGYEALYLTKDNDATQHVSTSSEFKTWVRKKHPGKLLDFHKHSVQRVQ